MYIRLLLFDVSSENGLKRDRRLSETITIESQKAVD